MITIEDIRNSIAPELERLNARTRTTDHAHIGVEIRDVKGGLVFIYMARGDKKSARAVNAKELVPADGD